MDGAEAQRGRTVQPRRRDEKRVPGTPGKAVANQQRGTAGPAEEDGLHPLGAADALAMEPLEQRHGAVGQDRAGSGVKAQRLLYQCPLLGRQG